MASSLRDTDSLASSQTKSKSVSAASVYRAKWLALRLDQETLAVSTSVDETFEEHSLSGGADDGSRAIQVLEWHWRPKPNKKNYILFFRIQRFQNCKKKIPQSYPRLETTQSMEWMI